MSEPVGTPRGAAPRRAVVIGGGMAGMLAAAALSAHAEVTVVERDALPGVPSRARACRRPGTCTSSGPVASGRWRSCCRG